MPKFYKKLDDGNFEEVELLRAFETQEQFDGAVKERLDREREKFADYDEVKTQLSGVNEKVKELETAKTTLEEKLQSKDKEVATAKLDVSRIKIRTEFGLSEDLDEFLSGDTEDDIRAKAEKLKEKAGAGGGVNIQKKNNQPPKESPSKKVATELFGPKE